MMHVLPGLLLVVASPVVAFRDRESLGSALEASALVEFKNWAAGNCPGCAIFGSLIEGVIEAGFLKESSCTWNQNTLQAELDSDHLYGEIASRSRVPAFWKLDKTLKFTFSKNGDKTVVTSQGLGTQPPKQGLDFYKAALKEANLKGKDCVDDPECIQKERDAMGKYLKSNWKKIKKDKRKITKLLKTTYDNFVIYGIVNAKGDWPKIMYSWVLPAPAKITSFVFEAGHVYATTEPDTENVLNNEYQEFNLKQKSDKAGLKSLVDAKNSLSLAIKHAKSGMNFGMMMAYGGSLDDKSILQDIGIHGGDPEAIANMFRFCKGSTPGEDPKCKGSTPGRVSWSPQMPASML